MVQTIQWFAFVSQSCVGRHVDTIYTVCVLYVSYGDSINDHFHYESIVSSIGMLEMH